FGLGPRAAFPGIPRLINLVGDLKRRVGPAQELPRSLDFLRAQRRAVHAMGAANVGRAEANDGLAADQRGLVGNAAGLFDRALDHLGIVAVDVAHYVPAVSLEAGRGIVGEPALDPAIDGNAVIV